MRVSEVSFRYAKALFELAKDIDSIELIYAEISAIRTAFESDPEIQKFIEDSNVPQVHLNAVIEETLKLAKTSSLTKDFLFFLVKKNRLYCFSAIVEAFQMLSDGVSNIQRGRALSAVELSDAEKRDLEKIVGQVTKKTVLLEYENDQSLVGGLVARVGGFSFDDSISTHLQSLKEQLKKRSIH